MMTLQKLTAAAICEFLARHTAARAAEKTGHIPRNDTTETAPTRGHWIGRGLSGLGQPTTHSPSSNLERALWHVEAGSAISDDQMRALFVFGLHPNAEEIVNHLISERIGEASAKSIVHLGRPFQGNDTSTELRRCLKAAYRRHNIERGQQSNASIGTQQRALIRTKVAHKAFKDSYGRDPSNDDELQRFMANSLKGMPTSVAGYALTFSPVKSVSVLWALAPLKIADTIELCHNQAVAHVFDYLQDTAAFSRTGASGKVQLDADGFIAARFEHVSRAEDPNLCTHIVLSNKVRAVGIDGIPRWLALDGRHLYKECVAASELYNTRIEAHLIDTLGISFAERAATDCGKRPVREILGVSADLCKLLSSRRNAIKARYDELVAQFEHDNRCTPTISTEIALSRRAAFQTREARPNASSHSQQRARWRSQATTCLGGQAKLDAMLAEALTGRAQPRVQITPEWIQAQATAVIETISNSRSTWEHNHVFAEAQRRVRTQGAGLDPRVAVAITDTALQEPHSIPYPRSAHKSR